MVHNFKHIFIAGFALLAAGCSNESEEIVVKEQGDGELLVDDG